MEKTNFVFNDKVVSSPENHHQESWTDKALREAQLISQGVSGVVDAAKESVSSGHRLETGAEVALSVGAGLGLAYLNRGRSLGYLAGRTLTTAGTLSFLKDGLEHGGEAVNAMYDAWHSNEHMKDDAAIMRKSVGSFVFDAGLTSVGGLTGAKAGHTLFKPHIPKEFFFQMNDNTGIRADYYNQLYGSELTASKVINPKGNLPPERIALAREKLPETLGKMRTYSDYWDDEMAKFAKYHPEHPQLDATGIKNFLVSDRPSAVKLDKLGGEIRSYAGKDLDDPKVMDGLVDKFQEGRRIIYGNDPHQARRFIEGPDATPEEINRLAAKDRGTVRQLLDRFVTNRQSESTG